MSKHGKLVNALRELHFIEDSQRSIKEIRQQIERYEKSNLDLVSKWPNGIPEWVQKEILRKLYETSRDQEVRKGDPHR